MKVSYEVKKDKKGIYLWAEVRSSGQRTRLMILRLWVQISSNILDGNGVKAIPEFISAPNSGSKNDNKNKNKGYLKNLKWTK